MRDIKNNITDKAISCPICQQSLGYNEQLDVFRCTNNHPYQIKNNIPVFVNKHDFDEHWDKNFTPDIPETKLEAGRRFFKPVIKELSAPGLKVLDAGCGDGAQAALLKEILMADSKYYGVDISLSAVSCTARRLEAEDVTLLNADIASLPFKDSCFDVVFSFGVIAYTPSPKYSFEELLRVVKKDGIIGIWIYPKSTDIGGLLFSAVRRMCKAGGRHVTAGVANMIVPFLGIMPTQSKMSLANASWKQCREVVMVNIAPEQLYFPKPKEILKWFEENCIEIIKNDESNPITIWGRKTA